MLVTWKAGAVSAIDDEAEKISNPMSFFAAALVGCAAHVALKSKRPRKQDQGDQWSEDLAGSDEAGDSIDTKSTERDEVFAGGLLADANRVAPSRFSYGSMPHSRYLAITSSQTRW